MNSNPVLVILNGLAAAVALVLVATNTTGVTHLDPGATAAVVAAVAGVCNLVGMAIRAAVVPVGVHAEQVAQALATPPPGTPGPVTIATGTTAVPAELVATSIGGPPSTVSYVTPTGPTFAEQVAAQEHADRKAAGA